MTFDKNNIPNSSSSTYINSFDDIFGHDMASLYINENCFYGYLDKSPIEDRLVASFNYTPIDDESKKPYKAHWMISESRLLLGYVNGVIHGKRLYTTDIIPEFSDNELLHLYKYFSGIIIFLVDKKETSSISNSFINDNCNSFMLTFKNGILLTTKEIDTQKM